MVKTKTVKHSEETLAKVAMAYYASKGWELFPEAVIPGFAGRPDVVMVKQQLCAVLEVKQSLSYPVIEQLTRWRHTLLAARDCQYRSEDHYGIPHLLISVTGRSRGQRRAHSPLKQEILDTHRIGHLEIEHEGPVYRGFKSEFSDYGRGEVDGQMWLVCEQIAPKIQPGSRRTAHRIIKHLNPDMRVGVAGASGQKGGYMTPFKRTMNKAVEIIERRGEVHVATIVEDMNRAGGHHYTSDNIAKQQISKFLVDLKLAQKPDPWRPVFQANSK